MFIPVDCGSDFTVNFEINLILLEGVVLLTTLSVCVFCDDGGNILWGTLETPVCWVTIVEVDEVVIECGCDRVVNGEWTIGREDANNGVSWSVSFFFFFSCFNSSNDFIFNESIFSFETKKFKGMEAWNNASLTPLIIIIIIL